MIATALGSLAANRARSILTVLSITIGAFAIVLMSSLAESGLVTMARSIEDLGGARIVAIFPKQPERGEAKQSAYRTGITLNDRERLFEGVPHVHGVTMFSSRRQQEVISESGVRTMSSVVASDGSFFDVLRMRLARGRAFTDEENRARESVCIIGPKLAERIGFSASDQLGRFLTVGALRCRISGVFADNERWGVSFGFEWNDVVVTPSETLGDRESWVSPSAAIFIQTDAVASNDLVKRLVNARLAARHPGVDDFVIFDFSGAMKEWDGINRAMQLIVAVLAGIALFVGGIGVMNMMLVAVTERVKEIGIRKALGARPRVIGAQFLTEAVVLSTLGGALGVLLGLGVAVLASFVIRRGIATWELSLAPWAALAALTVTTVIGVAFGWLPARKAARLDPIEAMRR